MLEDLVTSVTIIKMQIQNNLPILGIILLVPWLFYLFIRCISNKLLLLGIIPRHLIGLPGILLPHYCMPILTIFSLIQFP